MKRGLSLFLFLVLTSSLIVGCTQQFQQESKDKEIQPSPANQSNYSTESGTETGMGERTGEGTEQSNEDAEIQDFQEDIGDVESLISDLQELDEIDFEL